VRVIIVAIGLSNQFTRLIAVSSNIKGVDFGDDEAETQPISAEVPGDQDEMSYLVFIS
jgi:hypothetical protein